MRPKWGMPSTADPSPSTMLLDRGRRLQAWEGHMIGIVMMVGDIRNRN